MLNITQDEAERIAYVWIDKQETAINCYGGYPGELYVVRDMIVSFIRSEGEKYDGSRVDIMTVEEAINDANDYMFDILDIDEEDNDWRQYEAFFGESVQSIAKYLMTAEGGSDSYSAGCPYKEDAPAVKKFSEYCKESS